MLQFPTPLLPLHSPKLTPPTNSAKAIWDFEGIFCSSRHIPGVRFPGLIHPGILGCAPSQDVLDTWNAREGELIAAHAHDTSRTVAQPPEPKNVHAGSAPADLATRIGKEGARTIPGRPEHGGNCDIKNLSRGSKVYLPVHVPGANFSVGDLHFSQGDGEISFCGAIEMAGVITLKFSVMKGGVKTLDMKSPIYIPGPVEPSFGPGRMLYFEGFSVDEGGKQHYLDATVAYRQTCLRVVEYLRRFGEDAFLSSPLFFAIFLCLSFCLCFSPLSYSFPPLTLFFLPPEFRGPIRTQANPPTLQATTTTRSTSCSPAPRSRATSRASSIFQTPARRLVFRWISSTLTFGPRRRLRRGIWAAVRGRVRG